MANLDTMVGGLVVALVALTCAIVVTTARALWERSRQATRECWHSPVEVDGRLWCAHCGAEV